MKINALILFLFIALTILIPWTPLARAEETEENIILSLHCHTDENWLYVNYIVDNQGSSTMLIYDGAPGIPPSSEWPDLTNQIYISADLGLVMLKRINPPLPKGVNIHASFIPPLSQVKPGEKRDVKFKLKLPLQERSEYTPDYSGAQYKSEEVNSLQLWLGYFVKTKDMELIAFPANAKAFKIKGKHGEEVFLSATADMPLKIKRRMDDKFDRY